MRQSDILKLWNDPVGEAVKTHIVNTEKTVVKKAEELVKKFYQDLPTINDLHSTLNVLEENLRGNI